MGIANCKSDNLSFLQFFKLFPDEKSAVAFYEAQVWDDGVVCPRCSCKSIAVVKDAKPMPYRCRGCRKHFSVRTGSIMAGSRLPVRTWLIAMFMMRSAKKGISSIQLSVQLGITQKSAWNLLRRIRTSWVTTEQENLAANHAGSIVEVDEAYFGGLNRNRHKKKRKSVGRGANGKVPVAGLFNRDGHVVCAVVTDTGGPTLQKFVKDNVVAGATICSDSWRSYLGLGADYNHKSVNHNIGQYVKGPTHTNSIESFWALVKRAYHGVFHHISKKYLNLYLAEFAFRRKYASLGTIAFLKQCVLASNMRCVHG